VRTASLLLVLLVAGASGGCTSADDRAHAPTPTTPATCTPAPIARDGTLKGRSDDGTAVSALIERRQTGPVQVGEEIKVIVRMTGKGDLAVSALAPDGRQTAPEWGPEAHESSTFLGPGAEWGFGVTFDAAGCWTIDLHRRESGTGRLQLQVT
jgi:hypothetical protein